MTNQQPGIGAKIQAGASLAGKLRDQISSVRDCDPFLRRLDRLVAQKMGFGEVYPVTGQTYSRKVDSQVLDALSGLGQTAHKYGTDLRLLAHRQEVDEPFEA